MKLFICGHARSGKDTAAEIIRECTGLQFKSSSMLSLEIFMFENLRTKHGLHYSSMQDAFDDRFNHRDIWYQEISEYNVGCRQRLSKKIFEVADVYVGIRDRDEFLASKCLSDLAIWIDAGERIKDSSESGYADKLVRATDCDVVVDNSGCELEFKYKLQRLCRSFAKLNYEQRGNHGGDKATN